LNIKTSRFILNGSFCILLKIQLKKDQGSESLQSTGIITMKKKQKSNKVPKIKAPVAKKVDCKEENSLAFRKTGKILVYDGVIGFVEKSNSPNDVP
jgi:hypothetical protein